MSLEILGSRVLAPSYGSSVYVWGSLITVFLTALAFGYALGGRLADRRPDPSALSLILALAATLILPSVVFAPRLLESLGRAGWDLRWASLAAALVLFLPPSLAMGMVSPFAVRVAVRHLEKVGSVAGGYSALSTAGSIAGTILTAFLLIPSFSVQGLLLGLAGTLAFCAFLMIGSRTTFTVASLAALACVFTGFTRWPAEETEARVLLSRDTAYHHIRVFEMDRTRIMRFDNLTQGGLFLDHPERSVVGYEEGFYGAWALRPSIRRVCVIGLGAGTFPRRLAKLLPDATIDSVEIDPAVAQIAKQYFRFEETEKNRVTILDGRVFLARASEPYDLIVLDAFNATGVPFHLTTSEFFEAVKSRLTSEGVFAANFIGRLMGRDSRLFWASYQTVRRQFGQVYLMNAELAGGRRSFQGNLILLATVSADPVNAEDFRKKSEKLAGRWNLRTLGQYAAAMMHSPDPPPGIPELTDAYSPVEALQHF